MMFFLLLACTDGSKDSGNDYAPLDVFCDSLEEDGSVEDIADETIASTSGRLEAQLISDFGDEPRELSVIAGASYFVENIDVQGGERADNASASGKISQLLGGGQWSIRIDGKNNCSREVQFTIQEQMIHKRCILLTCED